MHLHLALYIIAFISDKRWVLGASVFWVLRGNPEDHQRGEARPRALTQRVMKPTGMLTAYYISVLECVCVCEYKGMWMQTRAFKPACVSEGKSHCGWLGKWASSFRRDSWFILSGTEGRTIYRCIRVISTLQIYLRTHSHTLTNWGNTTSRNHEIKMSF